MKKKKKCNEVNKNVSLYTEAPPININAKQSHKHVHTHRRRGCKQWQFQKRISQAVHDPVWVRSCSGPVEWNITDRKMQEEERGSKEPDRRTDRQNGLTLSHVKADSRISRVRELVTVKHVAHWEAGDHEFLARWGHGWKFEWRREYLKTETLVRLNLRMYVAACRLSLWLLSLLYIYGPQHTNIQAISTSNTGSYSSYPADTDTCAMHTCLMTDITALSTVAKDFAMCLSFV